MDALRLPGLKDSDEWEAWTVNTTLQAEEPATSFVTRKRHARPMPLKDPGLTTLVYDDAFGSNAAERDDIERAIREDSIQR
jgi:hypothetical protein